MNVILFAAGALIFSLATWAIVQGYRRPRSGPHNNWRNEDYLSRDAADSWTEGATYIKSEPKDGSGLGL